ncbi:hypothetical protein D3C76_1294750 [compost metagenome]
MACLRSSLMVMPARARSTLRVCSAGMMPLKSMGLSWYFQPSSLAMAAQRSMSKPTYSLPCLNSKGTKAVSVATSSSLSVALAWVVAAMASAARAALSRCFMCMLPLGRGNWPWPVRLRACLAVKVRQEPEEGDLPVCCCPLLGPSALRCTATLLSSKINMHF